VVAIAISVTALGVPARATPSASSSATTGSDLNVGRRCGRLHQPRDRRGVAQSDRIEAIRTGDQTCPPARHALVEAPRFVADVAQVEIGAGVDDDRQRQRPRRPPSRPNTVGGIGDIADRRLPTRRPIFEIDLDRTGPNDLGRRIDCGIGVSPTPPPVVAIASKPVATAPVARRFPKVKFPIRGACREARRWAAPERAWNPVAKSRNVLFQAMVKSITISWQGAVVSMVILDECWLRRSRRCPVFVRIP
jgi:hypothetical protein